MEKEFNSDLFFMIGFVSQIPLNQKYLGIMLTWWIDTLCHFVCKTEMKHSSKQIPIHPPLQFLENIITMT